MSTFIFCLCHEPCEDIQTRTEGVLPLISARLRLLLDFAALWFSADVAYRTAWQCLFGETNNKEGKNTRVLLFCIMRIIWWLPEHQNDSSKQKTAGVLILLKSGRKHSWITMSWKNCRSSKRRRWKCLSPAKPLTIGGLSSSSSSSGATLSFLSILLTDVVRFRWTSVSNSSSNRTWSTKSGCTGLGSAGGFGVP